MPDRGQSTLFPERLVDENNPVRVIDAFVDTLDLAGLGFEGVEPAETRRPAYHPSALLKLYIYGYLNRVQSSRRLEREAGRDVELMWLLGRLVPTTRRLPISGRTTAVPSVRCARALSNSAGRWVCFVKASVAIDGGKFKAVNNRDRNFTSEGATAPSAA